MIKGIDCGLKCERGRERETSKDKRQIDHDSNVHCLHTIKRRDENVFQPPKRRSRREVVSNVTLVDQKDIPTRSE